MGYVKFYHQGPDVDMFLPIPDHQHLARAVQCIAKSVPTNELIDTLLHFNLWQRVGDPQSQYTVLTQGFVFLRWLEEQASLPL